MRSPSPSAICADGRRPVLLSRGHDPGCTTEACDFRDSLAPLQAAGYTVLGISPDPPEKLRRFRERDGLTYDLLSDPDHVALDAYGTWGEKTNYGKTYQGVIRSTFVIDPDGPHPASAVQREGDRPRRPGAHARWVSTLLTRSTAAGDLSGCRSARVAPGRAHRDHEQHERTTHGGASEQSRCAASAYAPVTAPSATARISSCVTIPPERPHDRPRQVATANASTAAAPIAVSTTSAIALSIDAGVAGRRGPDLPHHESRRSPAPRGPAAPLRCGPTACVLMRRQSPCRSTGLSDFSRPWSECSARTHITCRSTLDSHPPLWDD